MSQERIILGFLKYICPAMLVVAVLTALIGHVAPWQPARQFLLSQVGRNIVSEKRRDLLREIDSQHIMLLRVRFVLQEELLQFDVCPQISQVQPEERERIESNLSVLDKLEQFCLEARSRAEKIHVKFDPAEIDAEFSEVGRLTAHLQVELERESNLLEGKKNLVRTASSSVVQRS